jgi:hypothetical protein
MDNKDKKQVLLNNNVKKKETNVDEAPMLHIEAKIKISDPVTGKILLQGRA